MLFSRDLLESGVTEAIQPKPGCWEYELKDKSQIRMGPKISTECFVSSLYIPALRNEIIVLLEPNALSRCCCYERLRSSQDLQGGILS